MTNTDELYHNQQTFSEFPLKGNTETVFNDCVFESLDFASFDFSGCDFIKCVFKNCNLSMVKFGYIGFDDTYFENCKLLGADFTATKDFLFNVHFNNCIVDYAAFMKKKNKKSSFINCSLKGTDFSEADLSSANFSKCDLSGAVFMRTNLTQADFTEAYNYSIDPEQNQMRKARFGTEGLEGLLHKYGIIVTQQ